MVDDFEDYDIPVWAISSDRVQKPPERGQILDKQILYPVLREESWRNRPFPNDLPMQGIGVKNIFQVPNSSCDTPTCLTRVVFELLQSRFC